MLRAMAALPLVFSLYLIGVSPTIAQDSVAKDAAIIKSVDRFAKGNAAAIEAVNRLSALPPSEIPAMLQQMQGCTPLTANWFRAAIEASHQSDPKALPTERIKGFLKDTSNDSFARSLAFDLIVANEPESRADLIATFMEDPCLELRFLAVGQGLDAAKQLAEADQSEQALSQFRRLLAAARNTDQISDIASQMESLGQSVDLTQHYGFLTTWSLIGPFDNREKAGFDVAYPPEKEINLSASLTGKEDEKLEWQPHTTEVDLGVIDLNETLGKNMGAIAYGVAEFSSAEEMPAEIRIGTPNANKVWLNGELVISNQVYHAGNSVDKYAAPITLRKGVNTILVKACQNEQTDSWAQDWQFQLRNR